MSNQDTPSPDQFGWRKIGDTWKPVWMTIPEVSKACQEFIKCSCKLKCTRCKCAKNSLDFASEHSLTVGIVFIRVTCKLFESIGFFIFWSRDFPNMVMTLKS